MHQERFSIATQGRGTYELTTQIQTWVQGLGILQGLCHIFVQHTSASLIVCENADPQVRSDLERFLIEIVPDGSPLFAHVSEGPDDMPAHVRSILTNMDLTVPIQNGRLALGIWQGIYLYEHRHHAHHRQVLVTVLD